MSTRRMSDGTFPKKDHPIEYRAWCKIKSRCYTTTDPAYHYYGGRGIGMDTTWRDSFENFYTDMGARPTSMTSIDRIDTNGDYTKNNCRWADATTQNRNKRTPINNTSSHKGVNFFKPRGTWQARIGVGSGRKLLGYFKTKEAAIRARQRAEKELGYGS